MALGKIRSSRRPPLSSSSSYKSTITTLVFVALCVVGLWMLTSSSFVTTSSSSSTTSRMTRSFTSNAPPLVKPIRGDDESHHAADPFEDNPGELPDDALKRGHQTSNSEEVDKVNLLERSRDPETTAAVEQETGNGNGESVVKTEEEDSGSHNQQQEEHDSQATEERNQDQLNDQKQQQSDAQHEMEPQHTQESETQNTQESEAQNTQESEAQTTQENEAQSTQESEAQNTQESEAQNTQESEAQNTQESGVQNEQEIKQETEIQTHENLQQENTATPEVEEKSGGIQESGGERTQAHESEQPTEVNQQPGIPKESTESKEAWSTQADQSENQKERKTDNWSMKEYTWELCNVSAGADYIPCLDNEEALKKIHNTGHYEHRERHCPEEGPTCLVQLPSGYKRTIEWPSSRDKIWYHNVPHTKLAEVKGHQNWVKVTGEFLTFPGGGTQFIHGALHYIDFLQKSQANIAWGKHTRTVLDVGCGVASFGGFLFERDVLTMSFAPKDEHEAQVQFALERGIPAISAVMGTQRLPFPGIVFDLVHCARCRVPWHKEGGTLLLELNRVLRPGGYFVWSATPVYQKLPEDVEIWKEMKSLTASMCWELVTIQKDKLNSVGAAIYRKPTTNDCYNKRKHNKPPMCKDDNDPNAAWSVPLQSCLHKVPVDESQRGSRWPDNWPARVHKAPYWLNNAQKGIYGKPAPDDFVADHEHWRQVVTKTYMSGLQISWSNVRNVMDMRAVYGGFAAALKDLKVWVMNVVGVDGPDTLPIIYERGMFGIYHDWCESFSTYPRTYDLLHADHLFSSLKQRCKLLPVIVEVDRIARPGGKLIVRDDPNTISEIENILKSLQWVIHLTSSNDGEGILSAEKSDWRPDTKLSSS